MLELKQGDFFDKIKEVPDNSIDCIITDPPYAMTKNKWDKPLNWGDVWKEFNRVVVPNGIFVICSMPPFYVDVISANRKNFRYEWIYHKTKATNFLNAKIQPMRIHENILIFYRQKGTYNPQKTEGKPYVSKFNRKEFTSNYDPFPENDIVNETGERNPVDVIKFNNGNVNEMGLHPTQKPVELLKYLVNTYTNGGDTVLDPFMGSGTTGIACKSLKRNFIGIEKNKEYFSTAKERIQCSLSKIS